MVFLGRALPLNTEMCLGCELQKAVEVALKILMHCLTPPCSSFLVHRVLMVQDFWQFLDDYFWPILNLL